MIPLAVASEMEPGAPHVRNPLNVRTAVALFVAALLPAALMGVYNTGYQANLTMQELGIAAAPGWRGALVSWLGMGYQPSDAWAAVVHGLLYVGPVLATATAVGLAWIYSFAILRRRAAGPGVFATALVVTLMLPPTVPLWMVALGMSFGIVLCREAFGGFGRNVLNPAVVALAVLHIAYPAAVMADHVWVPVTGYASGTALDIAHDGGLGALRVADIDWMEAFVGLTPGGMGETSALAIAIGGLALIVSGLVCWRILAGIFVGVALASMGFAGSGGEGFATLPVSWHFVLGSLAFGAVFVATDPVTAAATPGGRWIYGSLVGVLTILIRVAAPAHTDGTIFAILLAAVFAPSIDYCVVWAHTRRRSRAIERGMQQ